VNRKPFVFLDLVSFWIHNETIMAVNLSIKSVPDALVEKLRERAEKNHRSLQGELITILEETLEGSRVLSASEAIHQLQRIGLKTRSESTKLIREDRNRK
jgi:plasmid stability protein